MTTIAQRSQYSPSVTRGLAIMERFNRVQIKFGEITDLVTDALSRHEWMDSPNMEELLAADAWARNEVGACLKC